MNLQVERLRSRPSRGKIAAFADTPKGYLLFILLALLTIVAAYSRSGAGLLNVAIAVGFAVCLDLIAGYWQKRRRKLPDGAILTGLLVSMVLSPSVPWYVVVSTTGIGLMSKYIFQLRKKPIFNPAAFGLLMALLINSSGQDWWGALPSLPGWCIVFVLVGGAVITRRANKFPQVFAFLGVYLGLFLLMGAFHWGAAGEIFRVPFINSALFLAFFMVTDPPTSPGKYREQLLFGSVAAIVSVGVNYAFGGLSFLLVGLLSANSLYALYNKVGNVQVNRVQRQQAQGGR